MRKLLFIAVLLCLAAVAQAQPMPGPYNVAGRNPDGTPYSGLVFLVDRGNGTWRLEWDINGQRIQGWGMTQDNALAAAYPLDGRVGVVLYRQDGDAWRGVWSVTNGPRGTEVLTPR